MTKNQILQIIGQLEASIDTIGMDTLISEEQFEHYTNDIYACISKWRQQIRILAIIDKNKGGE